MKNKANVFDEASKDLEITLWQGKDLGLKPDHPKLVSIRHAIAVLRAAGKADPLNIIDKKLHDAVKKARDAGKDEKR